MESGSDLTVLITIIGTGVAIIIALFAFGVFFLRRLDDVARDIRTEVRTGFESVQAEFAIVRNEMRAEFTNVRTETQTEFTNVRTETQAEFANVRNEMQNVRTDLGSRIDGVNGRLDQMILALGLPAFQQAAAAADPAGPAEQRPSAA